MTNNNIKYLANNVHPFSINDIKRKVGQYTQHQEGPLFVALGGIHGNEYAGIEALNRIFRQLEVLKPIIKGTFVGIAGNVTALQQNRRFIDQDLNRQWLPEKIAHVRETPKYLLQTNEECQQKELITLLDRVRNDKKHTSLSLLDLHTTSAKGGTYCIAPTHHGSQQLALNLPIPTIIGLEKVVNGTTMHYCNSESMTSFCLEAGQHENPASADRMEAAIWLTLVAVGCLAAVDVPDLEKHKAILAKLGENRPHLVNFLYRHPVAIEDEFVMKEGYKNFQLITKGEHLANDKNGKIIAPFGGMILMPLYQKQGEDGFFIVEEVLTNE